MRNLFLGPAKNSSKRMVAREICGISYVTNTIPDVIATSFLLETQCEIVLLSFGPNDECFLNKKRIVQ
jgi:hypothetical protein